MSRRWRETNQPTKSMPLPFSDNHLEVTKGRDQFVIEIILKVGNVNNEIPTLSWYLYVYL